MIPTTQDPQTEKQTVWNDRTGKTEDVDPGTDPNALAKPDSGSSKAFTDIVFKPDAQLKILKNLEQVYADSPFGISFRQRAEEDHSFYSPKMIDANRAAQEGVAQGVMNLAIDVPALNLVERGRKLQDSYTSLMESVSQPKGIWDIATKGLQKMFFESPEEASKRVEARMGAVQLNVGGTVMPVSSWVQKIGFDMLKFSEEKIKSFGLDKQYKTGVEKFSNELAQNATSLAYALGVSYLTKSEHIAAASFGLIQKASIYKEATQTANVKDMKTGKIVQIPYDQFKDKFQQDVEGKYVKDQMSIDGSMMMVRPPMDSSKASTFSTIGAIPEAAFEYVGLQMIMKGLRGVKPLLRTTMITLEQGIQEGLQQGSEELMAKVGWDRPGTKTDIAKRIGYAALMGMILGVPAGGMSSFAMTQDFKGKLMNDKNLTEEEADEFMKKIYEPAVSRVYEIGGQEAEEFVNGILKENGIALAQKVDKGRGIKKNERTGDFEYYEYSKMSGRTLKVLMKDKDLTTLEQMVTGFQEAEKEREEKSNILESGASEITKQEVLKQWDKLKTLIPERYHAVLTDLVGKDYNGFTALVQKLIVLTKDATKTTVPHEVFHVIYNDVLTQEDRDALHAEINTITGLNDALEIEEYLAERFGEHWVGRDEKTKTIGGKVEQFIRDIVQFLKDFALGENPFASQMQRTFDKIIKNQLEMNEKAKALNENIKMQSKKAMEREGVKSLLKGTKVLDDNGNPLIVYHGTNKDFKKFDPEKSTNAHSRSAGVPMFFFSSNPDLAGTYLRNEGQGTNIRPSFLSMKNPLVIDMKGGIWIDAIDKVSDKLQIYYTKEQKQFYDYRDKVAEQYENDFDLPKEVDAEVTRLQDLADESIRKAGGYEKLKSSAKSLVHDGVIFKNVFDPGGFGFQSEEKFVPINDVYAVFDPNQVVSIFDPEISVKLKKISDDPTRVVVDGEIVSVKEILGPVKFQMKIATMNGIMELNPGTELIKKSGLFSEKDVNKPIESKEKPGSVFKFNEKADTVEKGEYAGKSEMWANADIMAKKMLSGEVKVIESNGDLYFIAEGNGAESIPAYRYPTPFKETNIKVKAYILDMPAVYTCRNATKCAASCYAVGAQVQYPAAKLGRFANLYMWMNHREEFAKRCQEQLDGNAFSLVRIHSSGDIFSQTYLDFLTDMAESNPEKIFYVYSKADPGELDFDKLDGLKNFNRVRSLLPDGSINYGNQEYLEKKSKEFKIPICPASKQVHDIQAKIKDAKGNKEEIDRLRAEYKDESKAIHCANQDYTGKGKKCNLCTKNKNMLFLEHGTPQLKAADQMLNDVRDPSYWEGIRYQKKPRPKNAAGKLIPPVGRGGLQSPEIDFSKIKDKNLGIQYSTETAIRNLEDIIDDPTTLESVKRFLTDAVRDNETSRATEATAMRMYVSMEMKRLGIKVRSEESKLVQQFGEKKITLQQLQAASPQKWAEIQEAAKLFRDLYDDFIARWNAVLQRFDYDTITPLPDYFRHFQLIGNIIEHIGMLGKMDKLPAEIYGLSQYFQPGKPFTTAQLKREGFQTTEDAISGFDNYIDSVTRVIHHTDSVQRARVLEKYVGQAIEEKEAELPKMRMWLKEYGNLLAGKQSAWDRVPESEIGRTLLSGFTFVKTQVAKNMFLGNISSAMIQLAPFTQALADTQKAAFARGLIESVRTPFLTSEFNIAGQRSEFYARRYPEQKIDYTSWESVEKAAGDMFAIMDQFAAKTVIAGYFHEGIQKGMTTAEAMEYADDQAARIMADRSWGALPNIFKSKVLGFFTQFQIEVNNSFRQMLKDVPRKKKNDLMATWTIAQWLILSTLFNDAFDKLLGRRPLFDPIEFLITMLGWNDSGKKKSFGVKLRQAGGELIQNLPFTGVASGRFPVMAFLPDVPGALEGKKKWGTELMKPVYYLASPFAGGQVKKSVEGLSAYAKGKVVTPKRHDVKYRIKQNASNFVRAILFGKNSFPEAVKYYNSVGRKKSSKSVL